MSPFSAVPDNFSVSPSLARYVDNHNGVVQSKAAADDM
jgi:hypothetical protein